MLLSSFFHTTEFYVIMAVVAAAVVALAARPQTRGAVTEHLLASYLLEADRESDADDSPRLEIRCLPNGHVTLLRQGLSDIYMSGAVTLAVESDGVNVRIQERLAPGSPYDRRAATAVFDIEFLRPGRYHVQYHSESTGLFAAFPLHVREGIVARRQLNH